MQTIGKGAFGYVRLARRRADQQLVSFAFTCQSRQPSWTCWSHCELWSHLLAGCGLQQLDLPKSCANGN